MFIDIDIDIITAYEVRNWSQGEDFFRFALDKDQNEKLH
jgi:hypothetical protein